MSLSIRPHTGSHSPTRPQSSYSARSTIRCVTPSPDSLSEALARGFVVHSTPRIDRPFSTDEPHSVRPWTAGKSTFHLSALCKGAKGRQKGLRNNERERRLTKVTGEQRDFEKDAWDAKTPLSRTLTPTRIPQPTSGKALRRSHAGRISPSKRAPGQIASPRRHRPRSTPSKLPSHQEDSLPALPMTLRQDDGAQHRPFTLFPTEDPFVTSLAPNPEAPAVASQQQISQKTKPPGTSPGQSVLNIAPRDRQASVASFRTAFSTPGRDEMERKRGKVPTFAGDDGPFGKANGMKDLEDRRRRVSDGITQTKTKDRCGCGCVLM